MEGGKRDRVWVPDPVDGYKLGVVVDVGAESLTIELQGSLQRVGLDIPSVYCCCDHCICLDGHSVVRRSLPSAR